MDFFTEIKLTDLIQSVMSIASFIIALMAYNLVNKISFKKSIKDRQFELVCEFMKSFSETHITISYQPKNGGGGSATFYLPYLKSKNFKSEFSDLFKCGNLIIQEEGLNFKFNNLIGNPFLPKVLYDELKKLWFWSEPTKDPQGDLEPYTIITNLDHLNNPNFYVPKGIEFTDFNSFYEWMNKIMDITKKWLENHEGEDLKFRDS